MSRNDKRSRSDQRSPSQRGNSRSGERSRNVSRRDASGDTREQAPGGRTRRVAPSQSLERRGRTDSAAPRVVRTSRTAEQSERTEPDFLFGRHPVLEAVRGGRSINKLVVAEGTEGSSVSEIVGKAKDLGIVVQRVPRVRLDQLAPRVNHQGVIAYVAAKEYVEVEDILEAASKSVRPGLIVVLDEVEDPFNLGSILRSSDGGGVHGIIIPKRRSVPLTGAVSKASAGAIEHVPVARVANLARCIERFKESGYWVVGADAEGDGLYTSVDMSGPTVLVIGGENKGLSRVVRQQCDYVVRMPMVGALNSLNAGVAAGILIYEVLRQRGLKQEERV